MSLLERVVTRVHCFIAFGQVLANVLGCKSRKQFSMKKVTAEESEDDIPLAQLRRRWRDTE